MTDQRMREAIESASRQIADFFRAREDDGSTSKGAIASVVRIITDELLESGGDVKVRLNPTKWTPETCRQVLAKANLWRISVEEVEGIHGTVPLAVADVAILCDMAKAVVVDDGELTNTRAHLAHLRQEYDRLKGEVAGVRAAFTTAEVKLAGAERRANEALAQRDGLVALLAKCRPLVCSIAADDRNGHWQHAGDVVKEIDGAREAVGGVGEGGG